MTVGRRQARGIDGPYLLNRASVNHAHTYNGLCCASVCEATTHAAASTKYLQGSDEADMATVLINQMIYGNLKFLSTLYETHKAKQNSVQEQGKEFHAKRLDSQRLNLPLCMATIASPWWTGSLPASVRAKWHLMFSLAAIRHKVV